MVVNRQHPTTQFITGWMPFLPPSQQRERTEMSGVVQSMKKDAPVCDFVYRKGTKLFTSITLRIMTTNS